VAFVNSQFLLQNFAAFLPLKIYAPNFSNSASVKSGAFPINSSILPLMHSWGFALKYSSATFRRVSLLRLNKSVDITLSSLGNDKLLLLPVRLYMF
jgi:hypothetical protein